MLDTATTAAAVDHAGIQIHDMELLPWRETPDPGLRLKSVRYDDEHGRFLGLVGFAPMTRSGLHQHRGVATSFVLDGGLTDYHGSIGLHQAGINLFGATHDAIAYQNTVLVSRLEGPVIYPPQRGELTGLHAGSRHGDFLDAAADVPPETNVHVDALAHAHTGIEHVCRQTIFDYAGTGSKHRFVQLSLRPGADVPAWRASAMVDLWVRGGLLHVDGHIVHANCFVCIPAGTVVRLRAPHGALVLAWAEGPEQWLDPQPADTVRAVSPSLFGF